MQDLVTPENLEEKYSEQEIQDAIEKMEAHNKNEAETKARKILKKNAREIQRLKDWAGEAIYDNNFEAYKYAMGKLRLIYRQPTTDELLATLWQTSRKQVWDILNAGTKEI